jgi:CRP-like cAMP-binding protein
MSSANETRVKPGPQGFDFLRSHPVFGEIGRDAIERLCAYARTRAVERGTTIFAKGDPGTALFAVSTGVVKISVPSDDGREAVFSLVYPGEIFGEIALLDGRPRTADAVAMTDCELLAIDRRDFLDFIETHAKAALKLIELLCGRIRLANEHFEEVLFLNLPARLARTVLRLTTQGSGPQTVRKITITQRELGQMVGMTREPINKQLRVWEKRNWIRLERGGVVVLMPDQLAALAGTGGRLHTAS